MSVYVGIIEQRPVRTNKTKRPTPFVLEFLSPYRRDTTPFGGKAWRTWKAYRSMEEADKVRDQMMRKLSGWEWRVTNLTNP